MLLEKQSTSHKLHISDTSLLYLHYGASKGKAVVAVLLVTIRNVNVNSPLYIQIYIVIYKLTL